MAVAALGLGCTAVADPDPSTPSTHSSRTEKTRVSDDRTSSGGSVPAPTTPADGATPVVETSRSEEPPIPDVVQLPWLSGPTGTGVERVDGDDIHWQGKIPGEQATITGDAYQWFGADGSMVGCSAPGACLGVDQDGFLAIVLDSSIRLVYGPDGEAVGRFRPDGRPVRGDLPTLADALDRSGVDLAGLLDEATRAVPYAGGVTGDPHLLTGGGLRYSTQLTGEFHARTGDPARHLQVRLEPLPHQPDVSVVTAAALGMNGTVLEYHSDGSASLDGQLLPAPDPFRQTSIGDGIELGLWAADDVGTLHAAVVWPDRSAAVLAANPDLGMTIVLQAPPTLGISGLFGVGGSDPATDLQDRQGIALDVGTVVRDWRVSADESLFGDRVEATPGFPAAAVTPPQEAKGFAEKACREAGTSEAEDLQACSFDVALTGDSAFAVGHGRMATFAGRQVASAVAERWPAMLRGSAEAQDLPELIEITLAAGEQQAYRIPLDQPGTVSLEFLHGCSSDQDRPPGRADSAARLFDSAGDAVARRIHTCGQPESAELPAGEYTLVLAGPASGDPADVRVEVTLP